MKLQVPKSVLKTHLTDRAGEFGLRNWILSTMNYNNSIVIFFCFVLEYAYLLPWWRQVIWTIIFVAMACTATFGNLIGGSHIKN